jgi:putative transcriptional regulator
MIHHHPSAALLAEHASGRLTDGAGLVLACHIEGCLSCRLDLSALESAGGHFLEQMEPAPLAQGALDAALAAIAGIDESRSVSAVRPAIPRYLERFSIPPLLARQKFGGRRRVTPNVWFAPVETDSQSLTYLVHGQPGTVLPQHTHRGRELTHVLHGSFGDIGGRFAKGDFEEADGTLVHAPTVVAGSDCLCLISSDAPMLLNTRSARTIQALFGRIY